MKLQFDRYSHLQSPIHQWEIHSKLLSFGALIFAFSMVEKLTLIPLLLTISFSFYGAAKLPQTFLLGRLRYPGLFLVGVALVLPFMGGGQTLISFGSLSLQQGGVEALGLIMGRFVAIFTLTLVLFATSPFLEVIRALINLGLPTIFGDLLLLTYRYLLELERTFTTMKQSLQLRGFRSHQCNRRNLKTMGNLIAHLLLRSYDQSQRVYQCMRLRGYGDRWKNPHINHPWQWRRLDFSSGGYSALSGAIAIALLWAQWSKL